MRLRAAFRLFRVALHLANGAITIALVFPLCNLRTRLALQQRWSAQLVAMLGVGIQVSGTPPESGLITANHISFLDIYVINAVMPSAFVSKDDVRSWPLIGWLATKTDTIFMERGSHRAAQRTRESLVMHMQSGKRVALFPEGTTSRGDTVLPFHSALLQSAIDAGADVTPVALQYTEASGQRSYAPAYVDEISLLECLWTIASSTRLTVRMEILPMLTTTGIDRRHLSSHAHRAISHRISMPATAH